MQNFAACSIDKQEDFDIYPLSLTCQWLGMISAIRGDEEAFLGMMVLSAITIWVHKSVRLCLISP